MCAVHQIPELNKFAQCEFVVEIDLRSFNELEIRFIREVKQSAANVNFVDKTAEIQKVMDTERCFHLPKMNNNS